MFTSFGTFCVTVFISILYGVRLHSEEHHRIRKLIKAPFDYMAKITTEIYMSSSISLTDLTFGFHDTIKSLQVLIDLNRSNLSIIETEIVPHIIVCSVMSISIEIVIYSSKSK